MPSNHMENGHVPFTKFATLTLVLDQVAFTLSIKGEVPNTEAALAMLDMAKRTLELQARTETVKQMQAQAREQEENRKLAEQIRRTV